MAFLYRIVKRKSKSALQTLGLEEQLIKNYCIIL